VILPYLHHAKAHRLEQATAEGHFNDLDHMVSVERIDPVECRCLTVDEDHTFTLEDLVVHCIAVVAAEPATLDCRLLPMPNP
jgi:hypothetical protein